MKILVLILCLYSPVFAVPSVWAGNTTLTVSYPAVSGTYNKVQLESLQPTSNITCNQNNLGLVYMDSTSKNLVICTNINGTLTIVPFPQTCFNRYCSIPSPAGQPCPFSSATVCPAGYNQLTSAGTAVVDSFTTSTTNATFTTYSTVCCSGPAPGCAPVDGTCLGWGPCTNTGNILCGSPGTQTCTGGTTPASCGGNPAPTTQACIINIPDTNCCQCVPGNPLYPYLCHGSLPTSCACSGVPSGATPCV